MEARGEMGFPRATLWFVAFSYGIRSARIGKPRTIERGERIN